MTTSPEMQKKLGFTPLQIEREHLLHESRRLLARYNRMRPGPNKDRANAEYETAFKLANDAARFGLVPPGQEEV